MKTDTDLSALQPLYDFIKEAYGDDYQMLSQRMGDIIYLLHYLPEEPFGGPGLRNLVFVLNRLRESFRQAHKLQQMKLAPE